MAQALGFVGPGLLDASQLRRSIKEPCLKARRNRVEIGSLETELLVCCARTGKDPEVAERIEALLEEEIDWERLLRLARDHRMLPLLYWHLSSLAHQAVPLAMLDRLRDYSQANSLRNLLLTQELLRILAEFKKNNIAIVPYKGPVLASSVYGNLALRDFIDLDILVHKRDVTRARELLILLGYRLETRLSPADEAPFLASQREYEFAHDNGSLVELHWAVMPKTYHFPLDPESLWERLENVTLGGDVVSTLSSEDMLLILCVHGSKHFWRRLAWICDVAEFVRAHENLDWEQLVGHAKSLGSERMLLLGLFLANDLLGAALPEEILSRVRRDPKIEPLARQVREWLSRDPEESFDVFEKDESRFHPFRVKIRERTRDKLRYCVHTALVPSLEDWTSVALPESLALLYYVIRPIRLAGKYGQRLIQRSLR